MAVNQEMLQRYITLANEGKTSELAELLINNYSKLPVLEGRNNEEAESIGDTVSAFYNHLAELTPEGEIDPAKKEIVYKLSEEFARIRSNAVIETGKKYKEWKQRVADGEIQEANIVDDPGFPDALAHDMALCKTVEGKKLIWANQLNGGLKSILEISGQKWNDEVKTPEYQKFSDKIFLNNRDILDVPFVGDIYKQHTEVSADEIRQFHKMFGDNPQPATASYNFKVEEDYEYSPDKPIFYKLPNYLDEIMKAKTAEQLDEIRQKHLETLAKKLPSCAISKTIANEQKQLARIDAAKLAKKALSPTAKAVMSELSKASKELAGLKDKAQNNVNDNVKENIIVNNGPGLK